MYCKRCGYNLRGAQSGRCPECGARFDPDDPKTTDAQHVYRLPLLAKRLIIIGLAFVLLLVTGYGYLIASYFVTQAAYQRVEPYHISTREEVRRELGWWISCEPVMWNDVEPIYRMPGLPEPVEKCGLWPSYFYLVFEDDKLRMMIPAHE